MEITKQKQIVLRPWYCGTRQFSGTVSYGMSYQYNNSSPFFHIGCNTNTRITKQMRWQNDCYGCNHDIILKRKPSLADLVTVHGWSQNGLPEMRNVLHYYECYRNWFVCLGRPHEYSETDRQLYWQTFRETLLLSEGENPPTINSKAELPILKEWVKAREPYLQSQFHATMQKYEIEYITHLEIQSLNAKFASSKGFRGFSTVV